MKLKKGYVDTLLPYLGMYGSNLERREVAEISANSFGDGNRVYRDLHVGILERHALGDVYGGEGGIGRAGRPRG